MKNRVPCNDEALLLLLHGELSITTRLKQVLHLAGCPACRERLRQFTSVSTKLAMELAQPGETPRLGAQKPPVLPAPLWVISALVLVILGSVGSFAFQWRTANPASALPTAAASAPQEECEPAATPCPQH
jgi:anti-sigma factor RsiW